MAFETVHHDSRFLSARTSIACMVAVAVAAIACAFGWLAAPGSLWRGYLPALVFWLGASLGAVLIALIHRLTGGRWGQGMSRELQAAAGAIVVGLAAIVPLAMGIAAVYPWGGSPGGEEVLNPHQRQYFAPQFVLIRTAVWAAICLGFTFWLLRGTALAAPGGRQSPKTAAIGLIVLFLSVTTASVDGLMSLTPGWSSSLFGAMWVVAFAVEGLALVIILRRTASAREPNAPIRVESEEYAGVTYDLGNLLFAFNLLWVYLAFSQYLIIWSADLPDETSWYLARSRGWAGGLGTALLLLHFVVPMMLLMSREQKRKQGRLAGVAALLLAMRVCDMAWTIFPAYAEIGVVTLAMFAASFLMLGGIWLLVFSVFWNRLPDAAVDSDVAHTVNHNARLKGLVQ